ncbi:MarR family winged helix-turn-helix transcriptional regulator [Nocardia coffeae]|uniref:MarR family winged helix-turn-helix transcriptional regulator n=1 Tax=Nocardia coffeae TaxID=2873381 RepID=UPI0027DEC35A|nr:MarR family transcriptional regulator [Nocardia coffeae]
MEVSEPQWLEPEQARTWRAYIDASRLLQGAMERQLSRDSGIGFADFEILVALSEAPDRRLRMAEVADRIMTTRGGVSRALARLVRAGWAERVDCEDDGRGVWAVLTAAGWEKLVETAPGHVETVRKHLFDALTPDEVGRLGDVLSRVVEHMDPAAAQRAVGRPRA